MQEAARGPEVLVARAPFVGSGYEPPSEHLARIAFDDREFADWVVNGTVR